ncbi:hypothetical protein J6TS7_38530 [Paenibacillus dendritiformis]|nr:hypothetical protein J6TS7_38530 [Paenibacillus dendritiformis]
MNCGCISKFTNIPGVAQSTISLIIVWKERANCLKPAKPERIAVLHPLYLDYFFALDTPPIASSSAVSAMEEFATLQPYAGTAEIADLGSGRNLNLEAIIASNPDVIVTFKGHIDANDEELSKIAPVLEALSEMNPDYIIFQHNLDAAKASVQEKESSAVWQSLKSVKNNHVLFFDNSLNTGSVLAIRLAAENFMELAVQ